MLFEHRGILCRHIFCLMKWYGVEDIPEKYLLRRWRKDLIPLAKLRRTFRYGDMDEGIDTMAIDLFASADHALKLLHTHKAKLALFITSMKDLVNSFTSSCSLETTTDKNAEIDALLGVSTPDEVVINNPGDIINKGTSKRTRLKSAQELGATKKQTRHPRTCGCCGEKVFHDARTCPQKIKNKPSKSSTRK